MDSERNRLAAAAEQAAAHELPASAGLAAFGADAVAARRAQTCQQYRLAAILFVGGGVGAILPDALHEPPHPATIYLLPLLAIVSGAVCWALSTRLPRRFLHVTAMVAALEVALTVALADPIFATYYTFVAIFVAYVFTSRRAIALHLAFTTLATFAPLFYDSGNARDGLLQALIVVPTVWLAGGTVAFLRERLAASELRYRDLSERDPLTGVGNYRMLSVRVPRELRRHGRLNRPLALFVIDLDDFKRVNDSYGHQRGDAVLQEVGRALIEGVRDHDIVVRQGGDEFAVVAPETDEAAAAELGKRLAAAVGAVSAGGTAIGASMGSARYPDDAGTLEALLAVADARLRDVKAGKPDRQRRGTGELALPVAEADARAAGE